MVLDFEMVLDIVKVGWNDNIDDVLNYKLVLDWIMAFVEVS